MNDAREIAERYIQTWNTVNEAERQRLLEQHWEEDASYTDPLMSATGTVELSGLIGAVLSRFPGFRFSHRGVPDGHGNWVRFSWGLGPEGAEPIIEGSDVVELKDARVRQVIGFLDKVPAEA